MKQKTGRKLLSFLLTLALVLGLMPGMGLTAYAAPTETLLTTITATAKEQASYSMANVATVSFSYTASGSSAYLANWGWWGYGWSATVTPANGYTITKCIFYDDANRIATDSSSPFVVETTEEDKTPRVNGNPILAYTSKGITKIEVYGYATPAHTHDFTYSASGATITATCSADGCTLDDGTEQHNHAAFITLNAPESLTYDGSGKPVTVTFSNNFESLLPVFFDDPEITLDTIRGNICYYKNGDKTAEPSEDAIADAGTHTAELSFGGQTAGVTYTIAKADPTCTAPTGLTATYGQTLADVTLTNPEGNTAGTWAWVDSTQSVGNVVSPAATFKANFTPTSSNYKTVENVDVTVTVNKANQTAPAAPTKADVTVDSITLTAITNGEYKCGDGDWQTSPTFTGLAQNTSYTFRQRYAADENHNASVGSDETTIRTNNHSHAWSFSATGATITATCTGTGTCSLPNNQISVTLVAPEGNVYNGSDHVATLDGAEAFNAATGMNVSAADIVYNYKAKSGDSSYVVTETKNAGIYQALYTLRTPNFPRPFVGIQFTIGKADPVATAPTASATYGQTLGDLTLTNPEGNTAGTWTWVANSATSVGSAGNNTFKANFTPTDTTNYNAVENVDVTVTVNKADPSYTVPTGLSATYGDTLSSVVLPTGWAWTNGAQSVGNAGSNTFTATFTPTDTDNYNAVENVNVTVTVGKADPTATAPTATATYGQTLADVTLTNPVGNTAGTWAWTNGAQNVGSAGSNTFTANFTPTDTANYNSVTGVSVTATVGKADPTATAPTATATYGDTLGDVTLTNPEGNTAGTWAWAVDTTTSVGNAGNNTFTANFTPADSANYNGKSNVNVTIAVAKADSVPATVTALNRVRDGKEQPLVEADDSTLVGGTMHYAIGEDANTAPTDGWSADVPVEAEVNTYYVWYKVIGDSNHNDSDANCVTVSIRRSIGGKSSVDTHTLIIAATTDGKVAANKTAPKAGEKVTVTITPDTGFTVDAVTATDAKGNTVPVTKNADGTYSFTQPDSAVTVKATFKAQSDDASCKKDSTCLLSAFTDLTPTQWYHDGIHYCLENSLMNGVGNGKFNPNGTTSRAMIVTILYRMEKTPAVTEANPFDDVEGGKWYTDAVIWAAANKIVDGYGNGKFGPNDNVTREQLAAILFRYAKFKSIDVSVGQDTNILSFEDIGSWSSWSVEALQWAVGAQIMNGKNGKLVPKGDASRAEAATMIQRFCENTAK